MTPQSIQQYHDNNPSVYQEFKAEAFRVLAAGREHYSARTILHYLRHETAVRGDGPFKINDHMSPFYARLFEREHPEYAGFFSKRKLKV